MKRVVITGLGVVASNGVGLNQFSKNLKEGKSGIKFISRLKELNFACQIAGVPELETDILKAYFTEESLLAMNTGITYASIAAIEAWKDAGMSYFPGIQSDTDWDTGAIIGTGVGGVDTLCDRVAPRVNEGKIKRIGSTSVEQTMSSGVSAKVGGFLGLGGPVTTNSSACTTGTEAIINGFLQIRDGHIKRMLVGGAEGASPFIWAGFDGMRVLAKDFNDDPERGSRPMSERACGFVPSSGAGVLFLEELESAQSRGAKIYAEILGGNVNCGGQRNGGSMTAPNPVGVVRCIRTTLKMSQIRPDEIDLINGHLTATMADPLEISNWENALETENLPLIQATKSMIGHALGAAGGIESVAAVLQLDQNFIHGSINCEDLHPKLVKHKEKIVQKTIDKELNIIAKASFGFGDVNGCVVFKKWKN